MVRRHFDPPMTTNPIAPPPVQQGDLYMSRKGVKSNPKNLDSRVWKEPADTASYFFRADQADLERDRRDTQRHRESDRRRFLQDHHAALETRRWEKETEAFRQERESDEAKRGKSHMGSSSVHYSPLTHHYRLNDRGADLEKQDERTRARVAERGRCLYHKANTFNPVTGQDIVRPSDLIGRSWVRRY